MLTRLRRWPLPAVLIATLGLTLVACGDDDDETETGAGATTTTTAQQAAPANLKQYCDAVAAIETAPEPDIDFEALSPEQQKEEVKKYFAETFKPLIPPIVNNAPAELKPDIDKLVAAANQVEQTGDFSAFETPEVEAAGDRTHSYELANCGWARQDVKGVDYSFQGLNMSPKAGVTSFEFANTGTEMHELQIVKRKAGVTESFDQILELGEEEGQRKVDIVGGVDPIPPGENEYAVVNLERGEYLVACFLPRGATPAAFQALESGGQPPEGPPHFTLGMRNIITVA